MAASKVRATREQSELAGHGDYIPALSHATLTPLYDTVQRWLFRESVFKGRVADQADVRDGMRVLDLGCGTATLTLRIKKQNPGAEVVGLDADEDALAIAKAKASRAGLQIAFDRAMAWSMPYPDGSFDRVVSSLMFHHLARENKLKAMREVLRVLRPAGVIVLADLGRPHNALMAAISLLSRRMEEAADNVKGLLPRMLLESGFADVEETTRLAMVYGTLSIYRAARPSVDGASASAGRGGTHAPA